MSRRLEGAGGAACGGGKRERRHTCAASSRALRSAAMRSWYLAAVSSAFSKTLAWFLIMSPGSCSRVFVERATRPLPLSWEITMHLIIVPTGMTDSTCERAGGEGG